MTSSRRWSSMDAHNDPKENVESFPTRTGHEEQRRGRSDSGILNHPRHRHNDHSTFSIPDIGPYIPPSRIAGRRSGEHLPYVNTRTSTDQANLAQMYSSLHGVQPMGYGPGMGYTAHGIEDVFSSFVDHQEHAHQVSMSRPTRRSFDLHWRARDTYSQEPAAIRSRRSLEIPRNQSVSPLHAYDHDPPKTAPSPIHSVDGAAIGRHPTTGPITSLKDIGDRIGVHPKTPGTTKWHDPSSSLQDETGGTKQRGATHSKPSRFLAENILPTPGSQDHAEYGPVDPWAYFCWGP